MSVDDLHDKLIKYLLKSGMLARHLSKHTTNKQFYPVVVGGVNVQRCAQLQPKARKLLGKLSINDIDIGFVIRNAVSSKDDAVIQDAHMARMVFLMDLLYDAEFVDYIKKFSDKTKVFTWLSVNIYQPVFDHIEKVILVSMHAKYKLNDDTTVTRALVDTSILSNFSDKKELLYPKYIQKDLVNPIPFIKTDDLPFATCNFIFYDTVKVLFENLEALRNGTADFRRQQKVIKYIAKFCIMYTQVERLKGSKEYEAIHDTYTRARNGMMNTELELSEYKDLVEKLLLSLQPATTSLKNFEAIIEKFK